MTTIDTIRARPVEESDAFAHRPWTPANHRTLAMLALLVAIVYAAIIALSVRHYGGNLSGLIDVGQRTAQTERSIMGYHIVVFRNSDGYDGQAHYFVADDPFLQHRAYRDAFRYQRIVYPIAVRYQRIAYPIAVWAVSLGRRDWRPVAMVAVNLAAVVIIAYISGLLILLIGGGASPWWALAYAINPGLIIGVQNDLTEPLIMALSLAGLLLYLRGRILWAAIALALALLAREVAILFLMPLLVGELLARRVGRTLVLLGALIPYLAWQVVLLGAFGTTGATGSQGNVGLPLAGIWAIVREARHASLRSALVHQGSILAFVVFVVAALLIGLARSVRRYDVVAGSIVTHGVAALFGGPAIWMPIHRRRGSLAAFTRSPS